jgi:hypothetical protein
MNYCSVEDAWGSDFNKRSESETDTMSSVSASANSTESRDEYRKFLRLREKFTDNSDDAACLKIFTHINKCESCRKKLLTMHGEENSLNSICKGIMGKMKNNSDVLTLGLVFILILLIIKVFLN